MPERRILVWFRNDLRLHDNEMLTEAIGRSEKILPVYFFDPRQFVETPNNTLKTGVLRTQFLIESVQALRDSFRSFGGDLLIQVGLPEELIPCLVEKYEITEVYHHREVASEETAISTKVEDALWKIKVNLKHFIGHTLYNKEDLPFPIKDIPDNFARFKKKTEREAIIKACIPTPTCMSILSVEESGNMPDLAFLVGASEVPFKKEIVGGESASLKMLDLLLTENSQSATDSKFKLSFSNLSPWLANGCLSPRMVYWNLKDKEQSLKNKSIFSKLMIGLLWRDHFRFMFKKHGNNFFHLKGFAKEMPYVVVNEADLIEKWKTGETENQAVNAIMKQLNTTGEINYAFRNLVATYFVEVLNLDWTIGAAYFEEKLIDYAPATNWGNWANLAGVGNEQPAKKGIDFNTQLKNLEALDLFSHFAA